MNKEKVLYVRHILSSDFVQLDMFNAILAIAILIVSFVAFVNGSPVLFAAAFIIGAVLSFFNGVKSVMKKSLLSSIIFALLVPILAGFALMIYKFIPM